MRRRRGGGNLCSALLYFKVRFQRCLGLAWKRKQIGFALICFRICLTEPAVKRFDRFMTGSVLEVFIDYFCIHGEELIYRCWRTAEQDMQAVSVGLSVGS